MKPKPNQKFFLILFIFLLPLAGCTRMPFADAITDEDRVPAVEAIVDHAVDTGESFLAELDFATGESQLSAQGEATLRKLIRDSLHSGNLSEIKIMAFSDRAFPAPLDQAVAKKQKRLAESRGEKVREFLKSIDVQTQFTLYNMVEVPTALDDLAQNSDVNVRKTLEDAGYRGGDSRDALVSRVVSKAVVVAMVKKSG